MLDSHTSLLELAVEVAWRAGRLTLAHYQTGVAAETKADTSPVTLADRGAEQLMRELIEARFPEDGIIGEEFGETRPNAERQWILDPIDGTRSFVRGVPLYGVLLGVELGGNTIAGVANFPALNEIVYAAAGAGCWWNGRRARVSTTNRMSDALVLTTSYEGIEKRNRADGWNRVRAQAGEARTWGDCYGHVLVATGRAEAMFDSSMKVWDSAALRPIVEEAGGVFTDWSGQVTHRGDSVISTNAALAGEIRALLEPSA